MQLEFTVPFTLMTSLMIAKGRKQGDQYCQWQNRNELEDVRGRPGVQKWKAVQDLGL